MTPAASIPPISARGKARCGSIVSSATLATFSNPVMAKKASATPATIAKIGVVDVSNSASRPKSALPWATYQTPMIITITRPEISTIVITMLTTTD